MIRSALIISLAAASLVLVGLSFMVGAVVVIKLAAFLGLTIAVASTLVALSPRFQGEAEG